MEEKREIANQEQEVSQGEAVKCLCCGNECYDKYCPRCGQVTSTKRLTFGAIVNYILYGMLKVNGGFIFTVRELLVRPWAVIRDYVHGRRVVYMQPFLLLIALLLYFTIFNYLLGLENKFDDFHLTDALDDNVNNIGSVYFQFADYLLHNLFFLNVVVIPPIAYAAYVSYRKRGAKRFNWVEFLVAAVYIICLSVIIDTLLLPFRLIPGFPYGSVNMLIMSVYVFISLWRAFPLGSVWQNIGHIIKFFFLALIFTLIYLGVILFVNILVMAFILA